MADDAKCYQCQALIVKTCLVRIDGDLWCEPCVEYRIATHNFTQFQ